MTRTDADVATELKALGLVYFRKNLTGRDLAVGDIHGSFSDLRRALDAIGFDRERDRLFSVGDLVDRGYESHLVLDWLDQGWFHAICGNHDAMIWRAALGNPYQDVDYRGHGGMWLDALSAADRKEVGLRLAALPLAAEVETTNGPVGLVHADCPFDDWEAMRSFDWDGANLADPVPVCCLWSAERYARQYAGQVRNARAVVHGHTTVTETLKLGNTYLIDTGGWRHAGHFSFLDLESLESIRGPRVSSPSVGRRNR